MSRCRWENEGSSMQNIANSHFYSVFGTKQQVSKISRIELHFKTILKLAAWGREENETVSVSPPPSPTPWSITNERTLKNTNKRAHRVIWETSNVCWGLFLQTLWVIRLLHGLSFSLVPDSIYLFLFLGEVILRKFYWELQNILILWLYLSQPLRGVAPRGWGTDELDRSASWASL